MIRKIFLKTDIVDFVEHKGFSWPIFQTDEDLNNYVKSYGPMWLCGKRTADTSSFSSSRFWGSYQMVRFFLPHRISREHTMHIGNNEQSAQTRRNFSVERNATETRRTTEKFKLINLSEDLMHDPLENLSRSKLLRRSMVRMAKTRIHR
jgi:hypothetical protein